MAKKKISQLDPKESGFAPDNVLPMVADGLTWKVSFSTLASVFLELMAGSNWNLAVNSQWTQYNTEDEETNYQRTRQFFGSGFWRIFSEKGGSQQVVPIDIGVIADLQTHFVMQEPGVADVPIFSFLYHGFAAQKAGGVFRFGSTDNLTQNAGENIFAYIAPYYNQSGTAGALDLVIERNVSALGSGTQRFLSLRDTGEEILGIDPTAKFFGTNGKILDLVSREIFDQSEIVSINAHTRKLYGASGEFAVVDWDDDESVTIRNLVITPGNTLQLPVTMEENVPFVAGGDQYLRLTDAAGNEYLVPAVAI